MDNACYLGTLLNKQNKKKTYYFLNVDKNHDENRIKGQIFANNDNIYMLLNNKNDILTFEKNKENFSFIFDSEDDIYISGLPLLSHIKKIYLIDIIIDYLTDIIKTSYRKDLSLSKQFNSIIKIYLDDKKIMEIFRVNKDVFLSINNIGKGSYISINGLKLIFLILDKPIIFELYGIKKELKNCPLSEIDNICKIIINSDINNKEFNDNLDVPPPYENLD